MLLNNHILSCLPVPEGLDAISDELVKSWCGLCKFAEYSSNKLSITNNW